MDLAFRPDQQQLQHDVRRLMSDHIRERAATLDAEGEFPAEVRRLFADHGLFRTTVPSEYGGLDGQLLTICIALEEIGRVHASSSMVLGNQYLAAGPIALFGSEAQKTRYLPALAAGARLGSFALSEPEAGSDAASMRTKAIQDGDGWRISGRKTFITNADVADILIVFAKAAGAGRRSISAFILERGEHDWVVESHERKMGLWGSTTCSLVLEEAWVPDANRIGDVGDGMRIALGCLNKGRVSTAAQAVGIAQGALDVALDYVASHTCAGRPLLDSQAVQFALAEMEAEIEATRSLMHKAAWMYESGAADIIRFAAITKLYATDMVNRVTSRTVELLAEAGCTSAYPAERMFRDARVYAIFEGTNEIQKLVIAREMRKRLIAVGPGRRDAA